MTRYAASMKVCFSHITALHLLRYWSASAATTLKDFHHLRPCDVRHLPTRRLRTSGSLRSCATTEREVFEVLAGVDDVSLRELLLGYQEITGEPLHVLITRKPGCRNTKKVVYHQISGSLPLKSLVELAPDVFVCSPELLFVQMAAILEMGELIALGYELCGCYPLPLRNPRVRSQLTTPVQLMTYAQKAKRLHGLEKARIAARYVLAKSASVRETEVSILVATPRKWGGFGLPAPRLNEAIPLSDSASQIARSKELALDVYWPEAKVLVEYDGYAGHGEEHQRIRDSRRRDALAAEGIKVTTVTSPQFANLGEFEKLILNVARQMGRRTKKMTGEQMSRHWQLRHQARRFHHEFDRFLDGTGFRPE